jgi:Uri superfamily endonuclease
MPSRRPKTEPRTGFSAEDLPGTAGAYALVIELPDAVDLPASGLGGITLTPGCYVYAGSAHGPGGIRARVARHLKKAKTRHWHVDNLTTVAKTIQPVAFTGGTECAIISALMNSGGFEIPVPGFGSSDCKTCRSHLLRAADPPTALRELNRVRQRLTESNSARQWRQ